MKKHERERVSTGRVSIGHHRHFYLQDDEGNEVWWKIIDESTDDSL